MAETHVMYNSKRLIPAPFVNFSKTYQRTPDGTAIGSVFRINVQGTLIAYMGSPDSTGVFWDQTGYPADESIGETSRLGALIRKQEALRELFSVDGYTFEIQSGDGTQPLKCNPKIVGDIVFQEGRWFDRVDYTFTLEAEVVSVNGQVLGEDEFVQYIQDASESWSIETDETPEGIGLPRTYRLTHNVSATGKRFYDETGTLEKPAWRQAEKYVLSRLGYSSTIATSSGVNNLPSYYGGYNHLRTQNQDELAGIYSVTETWILASGNALEEFECSIRNENTGLTSVSVNGTITGLEERNTNLGLVTTKYFNAHSKFQSIQSSIYTRAQNYASGVSLNPIYLSRVVAHNEINGFVSYSYEFDNRATNIFSGARMENISISENFPGDLFAAIPVIGRANGPVLQSLSSYTERSVTLNIELAMEPPSFGSNSVADIRTALYSNPRITQAAAFDKIYQAARPSIYYNKTYEFVSSPNESFDVKTGRYNYSVSWVFGD